MDEGGTIMNAGFCASLRQRTCGVFGWCCTDIELVTGWFKTLCRGGERGRENCISAPYTEVAIMPPAEAEPVEMPPAEAEPA